MKYYILSFILITALSAMAQTGMDINETDLYNCSLGGMDYFLNSSTGLCRKSIHPPCPTGYHNTTMTPTPTATPTPTPT